MRVTGATPGEIVVVRMKPAPEILTVAARAGRIDTRLQHGFESNPRRPPGSRLARAHHRLDSQPMPCPSVLTRDGQPRP